MSEELNAVMQERLQFMNHLELCSTQAMTEDGVVNCVTILAYNATSDGLDDPQIVVTVPIEAAHAMAHNLAHLIADVSGCPTMVAATKIAHRHGN